MDAAARDGQQARVGVDAVGAVLLLAPSQVDRGAQHQHVQEGFGADVGPGLIDLLEQAIGLRDRFGVTAGEEQLFGVDVPGRSASVTGRGLSRSLAKASARFR